MRTPQIAKNCYTTSITPGYKVICNHGAIYCSYTINEIMNVLDLGSVSRMMLSMAAERGANAVINLHVTMSDRYALAFGDAVTLDPE